MKGDEHYFIYSCSKPITCTTAMQLYEKGMFKLDDELADYMPEFKKMTVRTKDGIVPAKHAITIRNLFTMTAGFSYDLASPSLKRAVVETQGRCPTRETMKYLAQEPLCYDPGDSWQYSLAHDVLAAFVEVVTGKTFNEVVTAQVFAPLGMADSTFLPMEEEIAKVVPLHRCQADTHEIVQIPCVNGYRLGTEYASGGAGCVSTVSDYMLFLEGMRTYKLLKPETIQLMTTDQLTERQRSVYWFGDYTYGLGIRCPLSKGGTRTDYGWGGAAGAWLAVDPVHDCTIYHAQHVLSSPNQSLRPQLPEYIFSEI